MDDTNPFNGIRNTTPATMRILHRLSTSVASGLQQLDLDWSPGAVDGNLD